MLTEYASWRWTLYVNTALAGVAVVGALATLGHHPRERGQRLDAVGTSTITAGLLGLVYGFSNAYEQGWTDALTVVCLAGGVLLISVFLVVESRVEHPILPLRVLTSRVRGASLLVLFLGSVGLFAETLFLTYYLQDSLGFSPVQAGLAFLPQTVAVVAASLCSGVLLRRLPGGVLVSGGMTAAAAGTFLLGRVDASNHYASVVLPGVVLLGAGLGLALTIAINLGVYGVQEQDAGVASATVNAVQQLGGSIGPSLFNTIAGSALTAYVASRGGQPAADDRLLTLAAVHSYGVAFDIAAAILLGSALLSAVLLGLRPRRTASDGATEPTRETEGVPA